MDLFQNTAEHLIEYNQLVKSINKGDTPFGLTGLSAIHKAHLISALYRDFDKPILVITEDEASADRLCDDINCMLSDNVAALYPIKDLAFVSHESASLEYLYKRLSTLSMLLTGKCGIVAAPIEAVLQLTIPKDIFIDRQIVLGTGEEVEVKSLLDKLVSSGYTRLEQIEDVGQFAVRGSIIDVFPIGMVNPVRIELWGDEIDTISSFDVVTQRRTDSLEEVSIPPALEVLFNSSNSQIAAIEELIESVRGKNSDTIKANLNADIEKISAGINLSDVDKYLPLAYDKPASIIDYFDNGIAVISEYLNVKEKAKSALSIYSEDISILFEQGILCRGLDKYMLEYAEYQQQISKLPCAHFDIFARSTPELRLKQLSAINALQTSSWSGDLKLLVEDLSSLTERGYATLVLAGTEKSARVLSDDLRNRGIPADYIAKPKKLIAKKVQVSSGTLSSGLEYPDAKVAVITHAKVVTPIRKKAKRKKGEEIRSLSDITTGDLVVHVSHGIGKYDGIEQIDRQGIIKDYIKIKYAGTDILYVPVTQLDLISKYIGPKEDSSVKLNRLNSTEWQKTRKRVRAAVKEMADELIKLYAKRLSVKGIAFSEDTEWQKEFEDHFAYQETDDQLQSIKEIKQDMERPVPMDRLLCGDVGFGKTEVALRAAFKCVMEGMQCAILVPTTVLAWQHYQTMISRMEGFPITIELLSRFRSPKQQKEIIKKLARGEIDIVVGTHRLVQDDIAFKRLGLAIIDEEQRFGVMHKERFKEAFVNIDILTLSATPIPRTLNMAMSGIRDMSVIDEPPQDRHPVQTYVIEHDMGILAAAINKELRRGGQVYYIHNRVETIDQCANRVAQAVPNARIGIAHGRMGEKQLLDVWKQLIEREIDVLVCTTLIETGVDVQNCNTLIIENADHMGLSQLYQLRGRVGRINRRAYAYFTFTRGKVLTEIAAKRLSAIREFTQFGSGFRIAMRDLEIRGAGNILGDRQHGHMEAVGYDMYLRLLSDAIAEQKGEAPPPSTEECLVDIRIPAHIPENYIESTAQRIEIYRRLASIKSIEDSTDIIDELIDRYGDPPKAVTGLVEVALMRNLAAQIGITEISERSNSLLFYVDSPDMKKIAQLSGKFKGRVMFSQMQRPYISISLKGDEPLSTMRAVLDILSEK